MMMMVVVMMMSDGVCCGGPCQQALVSRCRGPVCHAAGLQHGPTHRPGEGRLPAGAVQQRALSSRQLDAPAVLLRVGELHPGPVQLHRPGPLLEREAVPAEHVDQEGLRPGLPLLLLPLRPGPPEEGHRLVPGEAHAGRAQEEAAREERGPLGQHRRRRRWRRLLRGAQEEQDLGRQGGAESVQSGSTSQTVGGAAELGGEGGGARGLRLPGPVPALLPLPHGPAGVRTRGLPRLPSARGVPQVGGPHGGAEEAAAAEPGGGRRSPGSGRRPPAVLRPPPAPPTGPGRSERRAVASPGAVPAEAGPLGAADPRAPAQAQHLPRADGGRRPGGSGGGAAQVHPLGTQRQSEERAQLCPVPPRAARLRAVPPGGRDALPQPLAPRGDRLRRAVPPARPADASLRRLRGLSGGSPQDRLHQVQVSLGRQLAPAGHHVHLRHPGRLALLPGAPQLQTLREASGGRPRGDAVLLRVQQRAAVSALREPGLSLRQALLLLQGSGGLLTNAAPACCSPRPPRLSGPYASPGSRLFYV